MNQLANLVLEKPKGEEVRVDLWLMGFRPKKRHPILDSRLFQISDATDWIRKRLLGAGKEGVFRIFMVMREENRQFVFSIVCFDTPSKRRATRVNFQQEVC